MASPLPPAARDPRIDALRGLALLGVLLMNLPVFARSALGSGWVESMLPGPANLGPALFAWLGHSKFLAILAGLYGYGFARRAQRSGGASTRVELRRLASLAGLGVLHGLLWPGDILVAWAIAGLVLWGARRVPTWILVGVGLALPALLVAAGFGELVEPARRALVARHAQRGVDALLVAWRYLPLVVPPMVAQAAIGRWLGRGAAAPGRVGLVVWGLGLLLAAVPALPLLTQVSIPGWVLTLCGDLGATALAAGIAALFLRWPIRWFAPPGAAPLSNYLLHSLLFAVVAPPRLHAMGILALGGLTFVVLRTLSAWWLGAHRRGPLEALWRRLTYGASEAL